MVTHEFERIFQEKVNKKTEYKTQVNIYVNVNVLGSASEKHLRENIA